MKKTILVLLVLTIFSPKCVFGATQSKNPRDFDMFIGTSWSFYHTNEAFENIFDFDETIQVGDDGILELWFTDSFNNRGLVQYVTSGAEEYEQMGVSMPYYVAIYVIDGTLKGLLFNRINDYSVSGYYSTSGGEYNPNDKHLLTGVRQSTDNDGDGYTVGEGDCNDTDNTIYPGSIEICGDGIDQDCNGSDLACAPDPSDIVSDIKANGSDGPVNISSTENLSITIEISPGGFAGDNANWWLVAATPLGLLHYQLNTGLFVPDLAYSHQGSLFNLGGFEVLNISLPVGESTIYFGVDMDMNGSLDMDQAYYDSVTVNISDGGGNPVDIDYDGDGYAENEGDCNDSNPEINPGATEICDNKDNDCDGSVDEGGVCQNACITCCTGIVSGHFTDYTGGYTGTKEYTVTIPSGCFEDCEDEIWAAAYRSGLDYSTSFTAGECK